MLIVKLQTDMGIYLLFQEQALPQTEIQVDNALLEGHLGITRELLSFQTPDKKFHIGAEKGGLDLIRVCVHFPFHN